MRRTPASHRAFKVFCESDLEHGIDAALSLAGAQPRQPRMLNVHRPGKAHSIGRADAYMPRIVDVEIRASAVAAAMNTGHERLILGDRHVVAEKLGRVDEKLARLRAEHRHPHD